MKLHDYQEVAVSFLKGRDRAGLFLEQGLGKTASVLSALEPRHLPALVVAPKRVAENTWPEERDIWRADLSLSVAVGSKRERADALGRPADITVISQDNIKDTAPFRNNFNTLVIDESTGYKSSGGVRFLTAAALSTRARHCWILTGTPTPNGYQDIWSQIYLLDQGERLGKNITTFRNRFMHLENKLPNGHRIYGMDDGADAEIKSLIEDICLYMDSDGRIKLPPVSFPESRISLPKNVKRFYDTLKKDMVADMEDLGLVVSADNAGILSNRLSQVAAGFVYEYNPETAIRTAHDLHHEKIEEVTSLIEQATSPVLVAYRYSWEEEYLMAMPGARSVREAGVIQDWNRGDVPVLVAHPKSAAHGLNLQHGGNHAIWASPDWSLEGWLQLNKRLHRQGQTKPVVIHKVIAKGTTDPLIYKRLEEKRNIQQDLLDHLMSPM